MAVLHFLVQWRYRTGLCVSETQCPLFPPCSLAASSSPFLVTSIEVSSKTGGGVQMLSLPSCSENICIQTKHAYEGTCKQQQQQMRLLKRQWEGGGFISTVNTLHCSQTIHVNAGNAGSLFNSLCGTKRNESKHYCGLSEQLYKQMEADVVRPAASG